VNIRALLALLAGAIIGLWFPDVDHVFPFLRHRSLLTHGLIVPLMLYLAVRADDTWRRRAVIGFCLTVAVHLAFDLYPRGWYGYALLYYPFVPTSIGFTESVVWLLVGIASCLYFALRLLNTRQEVNTAALVAIGAFLFAYPREQTFWAPLLTLLLVCAVVACFPNPVVSGRAWARYLLRRLRRSFTPTPTP
jgi:hypothetical protein